MKKRRKKKIKFLVIGSIISIILSIFILIVGLGYYGHFCDVGETSDVLFMSHDICDTSSLYVFYRYNKQFLNTLFDLLIISNILIYIILAIKSVGRKKIKQFFVLVFISILLAGMIYLYHSDNKERFKDQRWYKPIISEDS